MTNLQWITTGQKEEVTSEHQIKSEKELDRELAEHQRQRKHYWIALVTFKVNPPLSDGALLDHENICGIPMVGCYICEQPWSKNSPRRCPGEQT